MADYKYGPEDTNLNTLNTRPVGTGDLEKLLDLIADALIESPSIDTSDVEKNQKFIRNGQLQRGQGEGVLALFQKDIRANEEDLEETIELNSGEVVSKLQNIADRIVGEYSIKVASSENVNTGDNRFIVISIVGGGFPTGGIDITDLIVGDGIFSNTSQFIPLQKLKSIVDIDKAEEFLDTNIFELLPTGDTRQARIVRFFQELNALLPPTTPEFDLVDSNNNPNPDGRVDRDADGNWINSLTYTKNNSISYAQDMPDGFIDEEDAYFHRLKQGSGVVDPNSTNQNRTIEDIYNRVLPYLTDILEEPITPQDDRPEYENQSAGHLQFRNPNQGIIVRNTNQEFIEGLNPETKDYLETGFTITMWVKFLDKVSEGTLFNFGNPTRDENPLGFKLETFVLNQDDRTYYDGNTSVDGDEAAPGDTLYTWGSFAEASSDLRPPKQDTFGNSNTARFLRLQVREEGGTAFSGIRDSHTGISGMRKMSWNYPEFDYRDGVLGSKDLRLIGCTFVPEDFQEWYFICASYNPNIIEPNNSTIEPVIYDEYQGNKDFWMNHINPSNGVYTSNSGYGNRCKVEIISRTDLLKARGFKVD